MSLSFETPEDMPRGMKALYEAQLAKEREKQPKEEPPNVQKSAGSKYRAEPCAIGGMKFASKKEARRWAELYAMEQRGEISGLQTQVRFVLIPAQREPDEIGPKGGIKPGKVIEKEAAYIADFVYTANGVQVVEDTKGMRTDVYRLKRKLMLWVHNIRIKET